MKKSYFNNNQYKSQNYKNLVLHLQKIRVEFHLLNSQNQINKIYKNKS